MNGIIDLSKVALGQQQKVIRRYKFLTTPMNASHHYQWPSNNNDSNAVNKIDDRDNAFAGTASKISQVFMSSKEKICFWQQNLSSKFFDSSWNYCCH